MKIFRFELNVKNIYSQNGKGVGMSLTPLNVKREIDSNGTFRQSLH